MSNQSVNECGTCGQEFTCVKTGFTIHDMRYGPGSRFGADLHACKKCKVVLIRKNNSVYFTEDPNRPTDAVVTDTTIHYDGEFLHKLFEINGQWILDILLKSK